MKKLFILLTVVVTSTSYAQFIGDQTFIEDSLMANYVKSGYADKNWVPSGDSLYGKPQGEWVMWGMIELPLMLEHEDYVESFWDIYLIKAVGEMEAGERMGIWEFYAVEDGSMKEYKVAEVPYVEDQWHGQVKFYYPSGEYGGYSTYVKDQQNGKTELFYKNDSLAMVFELIDGDIEGDAFLYYQNGAVKESMSYVSSALFGEHLGFYDDGSKEFVANYKRGWMNGKTESWYQNGNPKEIATYDMGSLTGTYKYYYENGQLWTERSYIYGSLYSIKSLFDENGDVMDYGTLENGSGWVYYYTEKGEMYKKVKYKKGREKKIITYFEYEFE